MIIYNQTGNGTIERAAQQAQNLMDFLEEEDMAMGNEDSPWPLYGPDYNWDE